VIYCGVRILKSPRFDKFTRKRRIPDASLIDAVERIERGLIDADLGGGVLKQRVAREGEGKSVVIGRCSSFER